MTDLQILASDVLAMFDLQREYFKTKNPEKLAQCKQVESALRKRCQAIVNPPAAPKPNLFDQIGGMQ